MKNKIIISIVILIATILSTIAYCVAEQYKMAVACLFLGILIESLINSLFGKLKALLLSRYGWKRDLKKLIKDHTLTEKDYIRISFAYLYRICVDGKYLLVLNGRNINKYQPVGGAYKCHKIEKEVLTGMDFRVCDDNFIKIDQTSMDDYRMRVPAINLIKFVKRFNKSQDRENLNNLSREFKEELINTKILKKQIFKQIKYRYCGRHYTEVRYSNYNNCYELLLADIVELMPDDKQLNCLRDMQSKVSDKYIWATEDEIKSRGIIPGTKNMQEKITDHSQKILTSLSSELHIKKKDQKIYTINL